jgi:hypothetical protein
MLGIFQVILNTLPHVGMWQQFVMHNAPVLCDVTVSHGQSFANSCFK